MSVNETNTNYKKIAKAIMFLTENRALQPNLNDLAVYLEMSEYHVHRLFSHWVGITPKQFLMFLTQDYAKAQLKKTSVLNAALESGLSSASRLHDLMIHCEGVTPGEYKKEGKGLRINYGIHATPFAYCLIASTSRGVCKLAFFDSLSQADTYTDELHQEWPNADVCLDMQNTAPIIEQIFNFNQTNDKESKLPKTVSRLKLYLKGTPFQLKVWQALLTIPEGHLYSYQQLADAMGSPSSVRAVASAVAKNNVGYLIPCHRVIKSTGAFNMYRWGECRKQAMIAREAADYMKRHP